MATYQYIIIKKFEAIDDIDARQKVKAINNSECSVSEEVIKLQEIFPNKPPRKIIIN